MSRAWYKGRYEAPTYCPAAVYSNHWTTTELNNAERSAVRNAGNRARTRLGDLAGLAGYLKWPVFVGFSRKVSKPVD